MSMMKGLVYPAIIVLLLINSNYVLGYQEGGDSIFGQFERQGNPLNSTCGPNSIQTCYLEEAFYYILFGPPDPSKNTTLYDNIIAGLNQIPDSVDLNFMLILGLQQLTTLINETDRPGNYQGSSIENLRSR